MRNSCSKKGEYIPLGIIKFEDRMDCMKDRKEPECQQRYIGAKGVTAGNHCSDSLCPKQLHDHNELKLFALVHCHNHGYTLIPCPFYMSI